MNPHRAHPLNRRLDAHRLIEIFFGGRFLFGLRQQLDFLKRVVVEQFLVDFRLVLLLARRRICVIYGILSHLLDLKLVGLHPDAVERDHRDLVERVEVVQVAFLQY